MSKKLPLVLINHKAARNLQQGHLWVYKSDIINKQILEQGLEDESKAPLAQIRTKSRKFVGIALFNSNSQICLRLISQKNQSIDKNFWHTRIKSAIARRQRFMAEAQAVRLIHGEADLLPGLFVDKYANALTIQITSRAMEHYKPQLLEIFDELVSAKAIVCRNDIAARSKEGLSGGIELVKGNEPIKVDYTLNGVRFSLDLIAGQKTGSFLDQTENQARAARYAHGRVLDLFCYQGGFGLTVAKNCETVMACDSSFRAIDKLIENAHRSNIFNVSTHCGDAFEFLDLLVERQQKFDTIMLDPPSFAKKRDDIPNALKAFSHLHRQANKILNPGGILISSSCSALITENDFLHSLMSNLNTTHSYYQILEQRGAAPDHPVLHGMPQTKYLNCVILQKMF